MLTLKSFLTGLIILQALLFVLRDSHGQAVSAHQLRRMAGTATADPSDSALNGGTVGIGSGNVGYTTSSQWRNLIFFALDAGTVAAINGAYRVELELDPSSVTGAPAAPDWRVDYLGTVTDDSDVGYGWNSFYYDWQATPGSTVGVIETDTLLINRSFEVSSVLSGLSVASYPAYLLFRVSSLAPPALGVAYNGILSTDLSRHTLRIFQPDGEPGVILSTDRLKVPEAGEETLWVSLKGKPSGNVRLNVELPVGSWLGVSPQTLLFTPADWDTPQPVTLTGNGDDRYAFSKTTLNWRVDPVERPAAWVDAGSGPVTVLRADNDPLNLSALAGQESLVATLEMSTEPASAGVRAAAHLSPVWTHDGTIYHVYVNESQQAVIAKLPSGGAKTTYILMSGVVDDPHYSFSLGIDPDGYIHVCGNMHNGRPGDGLWNYWISQAPGDITAWDYYADPAWENWPDASEVSAPGPIVTGNTISYVLFRPDIGGRLYMTARGRAQNDFGKGWTGVRMSRLNDLAGARWEPLGSYSQSVFSSNFFPAKVIAWDDTGGRVGAGDGDWYQTNRGQIWFDAENRLHLCWGYFGENSQTHSTSPPTDYGSGATHILYACSPDGGGSWQRADGTPITLPLSPLNADVVIESNPGDLTSTAYVVTTAEGYPVVSYSRNGLPMLGDPYLKAWTPGSGWSAARPLPTDDAFQILADRRGILTLPDSDGSWHRSYDGGETWSTIAGAPEYGGGETASVDYPYLQETGKVRFHTLFDDAGTKRFGVWTVGFSPAQTPSHAETWRENWFGDPADSGNAAEDADPDMDGVSNWIERALGRDPLLPEGALTQGFSVDDAGSPYLEIAYSRILGGVEEGNGRYRFADIQYQLQDSIDLLGWGPRDDWSLQSTESGPMAGWESVRFRLPQAIAPGQQRFIRLQLVKVP